MATILLQAKKLVVGTVDCKRLPDWWPEKNGSSRYSVDEANLAVVDQVAKLPAKLSCYLYRLRNAVIAGML